MSEQQSLADHVQAIGAKLDALRAASSRLSAGDKRAAVESRALALEVQRLAGAYRKSALLAGKQIVRVPKRVKAPKAQEPKAPVVLHMQLPSGEIKSVELPPLSAPTPAPSPEPAPVAPVVEEKKEAPVGEVQEAPKSASEVFAPLAAAPKPTELSDVGAIKPRPRSRK
jgi:hypothetical protein